MLLVELAESLVEICVGERDEIAESVVEGFEPTSTSAIPLSKGFPTLWMDLAARSCSCTSAHTLKQIGRMVDYRYIFELL